MLGYLYGKRFGSKIARANRKEDDRVGADPFFYHYGHSKYDQKNVHIR